MISCRAIGVLDSALDTNYPALPENDCSFGARGSATLTPQQAVTRGEWKLHEMPKAHTTIRVNRQFSVREIEKIKLGLRPESMDDHWFIFYEKDRLYIHRSWTGYCIFIVRFENQAQDFVACEIQANRSPKQYGSSDDAYDVQMALWVIDCLLLERMDARMPQQEYS